jgi:hypothetical protein
MMGLFSGSSLQGANGSGKGGQSVYTPTQPSRATYGMPNRYSNTVSWDNAQLGSPVGNPMQSGKGYGGGKYGQNSTFSPNTNYQQPQSTQQPTSDPNQFINDSYNI